MAANQLIAGLGMGILPAIGGNPTINQPSTNASGKWVALGFVLDQAKTLNAVRMFITQTGTPATSEITMEVQTDTTGAPSGSTVTGGTAQPIGSLPGNGNNSIETWSGFTCALSAGTQYWLVIKDTNATQASNFISVNLGSNRSFQSFGAGDEISWGWPSKTTTNSGGAWSGNTNSNSWGWRLAFSDSTYQGVPFTSVTNLSAGNVAFGKQEVGVRLVLPANATFNIRGVAAAINKVGSPTGNARFRLYSGSTLVDTTYVIPPGNIRTTIDPVGAYFAATHAIVGGTTIRLVLGDDAAGDTSGNGFGLPQFTIDNDSNSLALMRFEGSMYKTLTTDNTAGPPPTFSDTNTIWFPFALILDSAGEFTAAASTPNTILVG